MYVCAVKNIMYKYIFTYHKMLGITLLLRTCIYSPIEML